MVLFLGLCLNKFMALQIWAINFAKNFEFHKYSGDNNESICFAKCSFKLI